MVLILHFYFCIQGLCKFLEYPKSLQMVYFHQCLIGGFNINRPVNLGYVCYTFLVGTSVSLNIKALEHSMYFS